MAGGLMAGLAGACASARMRAVLGGAAGLGDFESGAAEASAAAGVGAAACLGVAA